MDPLSLVASIITVIGAGGQVTKTIQKLASLKDAPNIIFALNNEISDLRLAVVAVQDVLRKQQSSHIPSPGNRSGEVNIDASIASSLVQANKKVQELEILHNRLKKIIPNSSGLSFKKRATWLREQSNLKHLREDLRSARLKIAATLSIFNA